MNDVFLSTGAFGRSPVDEAIDIAVASGIDAIELSSGANWDDSMWQDVLEARGTGHCRFLLHNYFPTPQRPFVLNLAASNEEIRSRSMTHCRRAIQLSAEVGAQMYSFHAGFAIHATPHDLGQNQRQLERFDLESAADNFVHCVRELADEAGAVGVTLAVENNVLAPFNAVDGHNDSLLGVTPDDLIALQDAIDRPNVGILLDVAHLNVSATALGFDPNVAIRDLAPRVIAMHLSDNDGERDTNEAIREDSWFWPVVQDCIGSDVPCVVEVYRIPVREAVQQVNLVRQMLGNREALLAGS